MSLYYSRQTSQPIRFQHILLNSSLITIMRGGQSRWQPMHASPSTHFLRSNHNSFIAALVRISATLCELFLRPRRNMTNTAKRKRPAHFSLSLSASQSYLMTHQAHHARCVTCDFNQKMYPIKKCFLFFCFRKSDIRRS